MEPHIPPDLPKGVYEAGAREVVDVIRVLLPGAEGLG